MNEATELGYPDSPDPNGTAKKYYKRRAYYFGRHNTPESLVLFAEWKRRLIETGTPPEVRTVRADLEHQRQLQTKLDTPPPARHRIDAYRWPAALVIAAMSAVWTTGCFFWLNVETSRAADPSATIDDIPLTNEEIAMVRGMRLYASKEHLAEDDSELEEIVSETFVDLLESGPAKGPYHAHQN